MELDSSNVLESVKTSAIIPTTLDYTNIFKSSKNCSHLNDVLWEYRRDATTIPSIICIFAIFYSIIIIFGIVGNMCVILAISRTRFFC